MPDRGIPALERFAAAMARGRARAAAGALGAARRAGAPRRATEEAALMLMLHAGYPSALEALRLLNAAWPGRARGTDAGRPRDWRARGERLCRRVYGPVFPKLLRTVRALHPDLAGWMVEHGYGRVLARRGLSAASRERITVAVLAATGWERQLLSHLLGAVRCGVRPQDVRRAFVSGRAHADAAGRGACARAWRAAFGPARRSGRPE